MGKIGRKSQKWIRNGRPSPEDNMRRERRGKTGEGEKKTQTHKKTQEFLVFFGR